MMISALVPMVTDSASDVTVNVERTALGQLTEPAAALGMKVKSL